MDVDDTTYFLQFLFHNLGIQMSTLHGDPRVNVQARNININMRTYPHIDVNSVHSYPGEQKLHSKDEIKKTPDNFESR